VKSKRPLLIIVAGALCAAAAAVGVHQALSRVQSGGTQQEGVALLLAMRDIEWGEPLVLNNTGEDANVMFVNGWPKDLTPAGAITEQEYITTRQMRANSAFVRHEPVLEPQIVPEEEFVPPTMVVEKVVVDPDEISSGRLRRGARVDLLHMVNDTPTDFMHSVRIYAVGSLDARGRPVETDEPAPYLFVLIRKEDHKQFLKAKFASRFIVVPASDPKAEGPVLVDRRGEEEARRAEVQAMVRRGRELMEKQDYERALTVLTEAAGKYPQMQVCVEAKGDVAECKRLLAEAYCERARTALEQKDFAAATKWLDKLDKELADVSSVREEARQLREATDEALAAHRETARYRSVLTGLQAALDRGNLPRAEELIEELKGFRDEEFAPGPDLMAPGDALGNYGGRLREAKTRFDVDTKALQFHLARGSYEQARRELQEMRESFPEHPGVEALAERVAKAAPAD
jgi:tetratricopeptide (TPR) repeat protein